MSQEFQALLSNGTRSLHHCQLYQNVICNKWVFKIKQKADGTVERLKARLVAKSFKQQCGISYIDTFSPIIKPLTIWVLLALAVHFN